MSGDLINLAGLGRRGLSGASSMLFTEALFDEIANIDTGLVHRSSFESRITVIKTKYAQRPRILQSLKSTVSLATSGRFISIVSFSINSRASVGLVRKQNSGGTFNVVSTLEFLDGESFAVFLFDSSGPRRARRARSSLVSARAVRCARRIASALSCSARLDFMLSQSLPMMLFFRMFFVSGFDFEPDGAADEAEGRADLVGEEALEGEVQLDVLVGEEDEGRGGDGGLRHIVDADAAIHRDRRLLEVDGGEEAVHLACGDALAALAGDELDFFEEAFDSLPVDGGEKDDGGVVEVLEVVSYLFLVDSLVRRGRVTRY